MIIFAEVSLPTKTVMSVSSSPALPVFSPESMRLAIDVTNVNPHPIPGDLWVNDYVFERPPTKFTPNLTFSLVPVNPQGKTGLAEQAVVEGLDATGPFGFGVRATVSVMVAGHLMDGKTPGIPAYTHKFRMPIQPVDAFGNPAGPAEQKLLEFINGVAVVDFFPPATYSYIISQETISQRLNPEEMVLMPGTVRVTAV